MTKQVIKTGAKAVLVSKPKYIVATVNEGTENEKNYIFEHILKDSTKISQDDNTTSTIDNELSDEAIKTNVTLGSYQFETTVEDIQPDLLADLCGFSVDSVSGKVYAPNSYTERFAKIAVALDAGVDELGNQKLIAEIIPKVQLNSKLILESLSSSMAGFTLAGTAKSKEVTDGSNKYNSPMYIDPKYELPTA